MVSPYILFMSIFRADIFGIFSNWGKGMANNYVYSEMLLISSARVLIPGLSRVRRGTGLVEQFFDSKNTCMLSFNCLKLYNL